LLPLAAAQALSCHGQQWGGGVPIEALRLKDLRAFLDWVYERAVAEQGTNPGRTANKAREHLRAVLS
jgi:hypothetical protein